MRVRIANNEIEGYDNCKPENVYKYSDNELSYIFCDNCLETSTYSTYKNNIKLFVSKLRLGGKFNIVGIDLRTACSEFLYSNNIEKFNYIVENNKCLLNYQNIEEELRSLGLKINSISLNDIYYNIEASR